MCARVCGCVYVYVCVFCVGVVKASSPDCGPTKPRPRQYRLSIPSEGPVLIRWIHHRYRRYPCSPVAFRHAAKGLGVLARHFSIFGFPSSGHLIFFFVYYADACARIYTRTRTHAHSSLHGSIFFSLQSEDSRFVICCNSTSLSLFFVMTCLK